MIDGVGIRRGRVMPTVEASSMRSKPGGSTAAIRSVSSKRGEVRGSELSRRVPGWCCMPDDSGRQATYEVGKASKRDAARARKGLHVSSDTMTGYIMEW
jgi:hypothetical protein